MVLCRVVTVPEVDCKLRIVAVEELKTDTFVVPSIVVVEVNEPMDNEPLVKLSQKVNTEVELFACILLT